MKMMLKWVILVCCLISDSFARAQSNVPIFMKSTLVVVSEDKNGRSTKFSIKDAYMLLNISSGDFILNAEISNMLTGDAKLDSVLQGGGDQPLSFKGNINENLAAFNGQQNDERTYPLPGVLNLNGNAVSCTGQFDPVNLAERSESKNYRMDLTFSVEASKLPIKGLENRLFGQLAFEIVAGKLNIQ